MKRILIVDNDPAVLDVMQEVLVYEGFDVITTTDSYDILGLVGQHRPDLLLIDYLLNGINGGELCCQVKEDPRTHFLPVIIISAYSRVFLSLGSYGCDDFIAKPFDIEGLINKIKNKLDPNSLVLAG